MGGLVIFIAFVIDLIVGDPRWLPHPVRGIGRLIQAVESILRKLAKTPQAEKTAGVALVILVSSLVYVISQFLVLASFRISSCLGFGVSALMAFTTIAARDLSDSARRVFVRLDADDIVGARKELSMIVGRDTETLDEKEIARAAVETVAENTSDGVIAPLFYLAVGGPALAMAYKAVNTMDSMVGYKNAKYIDFGWAAARLDDAANYIPARIAAMLICLADEIEHRLKPAAAAALNPQLEIRNPKFQFSRSWRIMLRDAGNHSSPNSGYPEAAMAGALGVRLGGPSSYGGTMMPKPHIGEEEQVLDKKSIEKSIRLMYCSTGLAVVAAALGAAAVNYQFSNNFFLTNIVAVL